MLLKGLSRVLSLAGVFSFFFGGRALHEFANVERMGAEADGILLAVVLLVIAGFSASWARSMEEKISATEGVIPRT